MARFEKTKKRSSDEAKKHRTLQFQWSQWTKKSNWITKLILVLIGIICTIIHTKHFCINICIKHIMEIGINWYKEYYLVSWIFTGKEELTSYKPDQMKCLLNMYYTRARVCNIMFIFILLLVLDSDCLRYGCFCSVYRQFLFHSWTLDT